MRPGLLRKAPVPHHAHEGQTNSRWVMCMCARARRVALLLRIGEELWHSLEVTQFGEKRKATEEEASEGGEQQQEDIGETIHLQHT